MIQLLYNQRQTESRVYVTEKDLDCDIYTFINIYRYYRYLDFYTDFLCPFFTFEYYCVCDYLYITAM